jgi:hypothetical protein
VSVAVLRRSRSAPIPFSDATRSRTAAAASRYLRAVWLDDFRDTAAVMNNLDLIISADNRQLLEEIAAAQAAR